MSESPSSLPVLASELEDSAEYGTGTISGSSGSSGAAGLFSVSRISRGDSQSNTFTSSTGTGSSSTIDGPFQQSWLSHFLKTEGPEVIQIAPSQVSRRSRSVNSNAVSRTSEESPQSSGGTTYSTTTGPSSDDTGTTSKPWRSFEDDLALSTGNDELDTGTSSLPTTSNPVAATPLVSVMKQKPNQLPLKRKMSPNDQGFNTFVDLIKSGTGSQEFFDAWKGESGEEYNSEESQQERGSSARVSADSSKPSFRSLLQSASVPSVGINLGRLDPPTSSASAASVGRAYVFHTGGQSPVGQSTTGFERSSSLSMRRSGRHGSNLEPIVENPKEDDITRASDDIYTVAPTVIGPKNATKTLAGSLTYAKLENGEYGYGPSALLQVCCCECCPNWPIVILGLVLVVLIATTFVTLFFVSPQRNPSPVTEAAFDSPSIVPSFVPTASPKGRPPFVSLEPSLTVTGRPSLRGSTDNIGGTINGSPSPTFEGQEDWKQVGNDIAGSMSGLLVGRSIDFSKGISPSVAVGVPETRDGTGSVAVYLYDEAVANFRMVGKPILGLNEEDQFGWNVQISGDGSIVVCAAPRANNRRGYVLAFQLDESAQSWERLGQKLEGSTDGDSFGGILQLSVDGNHLMVGSGQGTLQLFELDSNTVSWRVLSSGRGSSGLVDAALSGDGSTIAIGDASGGVHVLRMMEQTSAIAFFEQTGSDLTVNSPNFISAIALSQNGARLALGRSYTRETKYTVEVYQFLNGDWRPVGDILVEEGTASGYGSSLDISNDGLTLAIGAPSGNPGFARVCRFRAGQWRMVWQASGDASLQVDTFGFAVAVNGVGNTLAVSRPFHFPELDGNDNAGSVRVFSQDGKISSIESSAPASLMSGRIPTLQPSDSPSISGNDIPALASSSYPSRGPYPSERPAVALGPSTSMIPSIAERQSRPPSQDQTMTDNISVQQGIQWRLVGSPLSNEGVVKHPQATTNVYLSGDGSVVAIGDVAGIRVLQYNGDFWGQMGDTIDREAVSVILARDGQTMAFGNILQQSNKSSVEVYRFSGGRWIKLGDNLIGGCAFQHSFSLSNDGFSIAIGSPLENGNKGVVAVYSYSISGWKQVGQNVEGDLVNEYAGASLELSGDGNHLVVGYPGNNRAGPASGLARVFQKVEDLSWVQIGGDLKGEVIHKQFGFDVAISHSGEFVAVAAPGRGDTEIDGTVFVYKRMRDIGWQQIGPTIVRDSSFGDAAGKSISLSGDGSTVLIGAPRIGTARVFQYNDSEDDWDEVGVVAKPELDKFALSSSMSNNGRTIAIAGGKSSRNESNVVVFRRRDTGTDREQTET